MDHSCSSHFGTLFQMPGSHPQSLGSISAPHNSLHHSSLVDPHLRQMAEEQSVILAVPVPTFIRELYLEFSFSFCILEKKKLSRLKYSNSFLIHQPSKQIKWQNHATTNMKCRKGGFIYGTIPAYQDYCG